MPSYLAEIAASHLALHVAFFLLRYVFRPELIERPTRIDTVSWNFILVSVAILATAYTNSEPM